MIGPVGTGGVAGARTVRLMPSGIEVPSTIVSKEASADIKSPGSPPVDKARIAAIRDAIAQGTYQVDSNKIAERMIEQDLPQE